MSLDYIEKIANYNFDTSSLIKEFNENIEPFLEEQKFHILIQKLLHIKFRGKTLFPLDKIPYTNSIIEEILNKYKFNSITFRSVMPYTAYNWHRDRGGTCLHIPLVTNEGSWFVYEGKSFHMPADGSLYIVNNSKPHTFVNSGRTPRVHLLFENL